MHTIRKKTHATTSNNLEKGWREKTYLPVMITEKIKAIFNRIPCQKRHYSAIALDRTLD